jgi:lipid-binding SYLF domain-containing protein
MKISYRAPLVAALAFVGLAFVAHPALAGAPEDARLTTATDVLEELRGSPDQGVPTWLFDRAYGVAVIPNVIKGAFFVGGRGGKGVLVARDASGRFSDPLFLTLAGANFGLQWGAQATDVVLVFATRRSLEHFARGQLTLGATASVAAGPVGRAGEASAGVQAEIYSYSRARGLFAGIALDGTVLAVDRKSTRGYYGRDVASEDVLGGKVRGDSESSRRFIATLVSMLSPDTQGGATGQQGTPAASAPLPSGNAPAANEAGTQGTRSFPLADPKPGSEPR